jgi:hypothetical protein
VKSITWWNFLWRASVRIRSGQPLMWVQLRVSEILPQHPQALLKTRLRQDDYAPVMVHLRAHGRFIVLFFNCRSMRRHNCFSPLPWISEALCVNSRTTLFGCRDRVSMVNLSQLCNHFKRPFASWIDHHGVLMWPFEFCRSAIRRRAAECAIFRGTECDVQLLWKTASWG